MDIVDYVLGMDYGVGVDALTHSVRGDALRPATVEELSGARGQTVEFFLDKVETIEQLQSAIGVTAEVEASYGLASGSGKVNFTRSCSFNSFSLFLLVRVGVMNSFRQARNVELKPQAAELLRNGKVERFREQYGDAYVRGIVSGGEFFSILELDVTSEEEKESLSAEVEVSAGGLGAGFDASASFSKAVSSMSKNRTVKVTSYQQGGDSAVVTKADEIVAKAQAFPPSVAGDKAVPYSVLLHDYRSLDLPSEPNFIDLQNAREVMQKISLLRNRLVMLLNDIDYVLTRQSQFQDYDQGMLQSSRDQVNQAINELTAAASRCANNVKDCSWPAIQIPEIDLPDRRVGAKRPVIPLPKSQADLISLVGRPIQPATVSLLSKAKAQLRNGVKA